MTTLPYHRVNVLTGTKAARILTEAAEVANLIKRSERPLLVLGADAVRLMLDQKLLVQYGIDLAKADMIPICATAHVKGKMHELGVRAQSTYDAVEIVNRLKDPQWKGVKGEGNHDLVIFLGMRSDLATQALSTLKHFAPHLKTMTLCKYYYPNADYSLPNMRRDKQWKEFLEAVIAELSKEA